MFFKGGLDLPPRIVIVDGNGNITLDALDWMQEQSIDLIRLRYDGRVNPSSQRTAMRRIPRKLTGKEKRGPANQPA